MVRIWSPRTSAKKRGRTTLVVLFSFLALGALGGIFIFSGLPAPGRLTERSVVESTRLYDRTGTVLLYEIHGEERRSVVALAEIPDTVKLATIAAEDINFYRHHGLDWRGILRALFQNVLRGDIYAQGGSTITQQLVKNSLLGSERSYLRKIREQVLALRVERTYTKDEIFELYLNQIPYGSNAYGIAAAAETYFAKSIKDLTLAEAATLASLPKAPTHYSPYGSHQDELVARRNWILERMAEAGFAPRDGVERAKQERPPFAPVREALRAPHFVLFVREYLNEKYGEAFVEQGGLKVITTLDWRLQEEAEKIIREGAERNEELVQAANAALVAIDPKTGEVLTMVGSRGYWEKPFPEGCAPGVSCRFDPHVNVATRSRQPGSAFKPFVYATAFRKGYTPETVLFDVPTEFHPLCNSDGTPGPGVDDPEKCYHPRNYDGTFRGPVTLRQALAQSLNLPSVKVLYLAGVQDSIRTAEAAGITTLTEPDRYGLSLVLGGAEVTLLEMTSAFGALAQDGILHPKSSILKIENAAGVVLEEKQDRALEVMDPEIARTLNDILSDNEARVPVFNPRSSLYFPDREVAAKTGTTQDFRDAWVVGYTPSLVAGVWVGNNDNTPMNQSGLSIMVAGPIWHRFLVSALGNTPPEAFAPPAPRTATKPVLKGIWRSGPLVKIDRISGKLATAYTPAELVEEAAFGPALSLLAFVRREDPAGEPPGAPEDDPQFRNWQEGIAAWISQNPLPAKEAPREFDDLHAPEKRPHIRLLSPAPGTSANAVAEITARVDAVFPLREVSLFIDDALMGAKSAPLLSPLLRFPLTKSLEAGEHTITISAYDVVGNRETLGAVVSVVP